MVLSKYLTKYISEGGRSEGQHYETYVSKSVNYAKDNNVIMKIKCKTQINKFKKKKKRR